MHNLYRLHEGKLSEADEADATIMVYLAPDEAEKHDLIERLKIDEHTLSSALDPDELARLEFEPEHVAMIFKRPKSYTEPDSMVFKVASTGLFLFRDRLVVVLAEDVPLFDGRLFHRVSNLADLVLRMMHRSIVHYREHLKVINMITDSLEQKINASMENRYLLNLFTLEKSLVFYLEALHSNTALIEKMKLNAGKMSMVGENLELLDDLLIENNQCTKQAEIYSDILASMMDARVSIVSNNLNVLMKTLNLITIGIMVPTLVVSVFSMNVLLPLPHDHAWAFWLVMALVIISVVSFIAIWRRWQRGS